MGQWDSLFAFRDAAMADDIQRMREVLASDSSFIADENPDQLSLEELARLYRMQTFCREGPLERVRALVDVDPRLVRQPWTRQCWRPLTQSIAGNQEVIFDWLLEHGADLNDRYEGGGTILHMAAWDGRITFAQRILAGGFPINTPDDNGITATQIADEQGHQPMADFLRSNGGRAAEPGPTPRADT
jgi:ankyrin repeat protein